MHFYEMKDRSVARTCGGKQGFTTRRNTERCFSYHKAILSDKL